MTNPLEVYLRELRDIHRSGSAVPETSYYPGLRDLLNAVGASLKPKVRCILHVSHGAGFPDGGLFTPEQFPKGPEPLPGTVPTRGVIEAKATSDDAFLTAETKQVSKYWGKYRQVLVTNYRDFLLIGTDAEGKAVKLESYRLASDEKSFWAAVEHPRAMAERHGEAFVEFLRRVMLQGAPLAAPKDVAWFMASHARDALRRVEHRAELPALAEIRNALEEALGIKFEDERGDHFFRSTLVQTLFYGVFSAWVLWARDHQPSDIRARFDWRTAGYFLRVPVLQELFYRVANPGALAELGLPEVLDWTGTVLNRIERASFFAAFEEHHAVQYFYEPFLEAYDPELRKQLGVWYTPREVVLYMVERVDRVLREELGLADGLADPNVYVLDPCCGTGSYLVEVLNRIAATLKQKGGNGLIAQEVKRAAKERVFGFEILPAPFVVAHLQLGLLMQSIGAPLLEAKKDRAAIYLTNALTGWEPPDGTKPQMLLGFPSLKEERDAAEHVKRSAPILVVLGNPPYNAFAGVSGVEEGGLVEVYKAGLVSEWGIRKFNLDDLYVRFFRLAERKIVETTKRGIVAFISNFSYLNDQSFVVLRRRFQQGFSRIWLDCMNGDSRETGKLTPDGKPDPSVFSTEYNREGIRVGTCIGIFARSGSSGNGSAVRFRHFWGAAKRQELLASLSDPNFEANYLNARPERANLYSFLPATVSDAYIGWPSVIELSLIRPLNGPIERRGNSLIAFDRRELGVLQDYLSPARSDADIRTMAPKLMRSSGEFDAIKTRAALKGNVIYDEAKVVRYPFKPFDIRNAYLDPDIQPLFSRPSPQLLELRKLQGNWFFITRDGADTTPEGPPFYYSRTVTDYDCVSGHARHFPVWLTADYSAGSRRRTQATLPALQKKDKQRANLSPRSKRYLTALGLGDPDTDSGSAEIIWLHALAIGLCPSYLRENNDGIRNAWPRIPLPNSKDMLVHSAELGRKISALLDMENNVEGVTAGNIRSELRAIGNAARAGAGSLNPDAGDLDLNAGWGHAGKGGAVMPGKGRTIERDFTDKEREMIAAGAKSLEMSEEEVLGLLGETTVDVYLNSVAYWRNLPVRVWEYTIGGYQAIKKWLSYRERDLLGRALRLEEVYEVRDIARRIAAMILLEPELDANYKAVKKSAYQWPSAS